MAISTTIQVSNLDNGFILSAERYHPGRNITIKASEYIPLNKVAKISNELFSKKNLKNLQSKLYLINTGDVVDGKIIGNKPLTNNINSTKKIIKQGDIIISRLRPYLRQVAYVDNIHENMDEITNVCSTEFYVLSPIDTKESIAFLVPYLLSPQVQQVLSNAVEGSQHPRFNEDVLMSLNIPVHLINEQDSISNGVINATKKYREYERKSSALIHSVSCYLR
ncbi:hypothetical protein [Pseudalkalibacillus sp. SCS-8]|uniref:hypothetical protein n=1 Tax=Pseudalkalibacillus nanhaiensis TaxID=3115291 RepID=UPI0032DB2BB8